MYTTDEKSNIDNASESSLPNSLIEEGAGNLKTLSGKINTDRMKSPSFLMVLTAVGTYA